MNIKFKKFIGIPLALALTVQLSGCGTILKPERKGQRSGQLDVGIVALNAIGLLFFLVPGVIAFAVDFNNGTIYLPGGSASVDDDDVNIVYIDGEVTNEKIEQAILEQTGDIVSLNDSDVQSSYNMGSDFKNEVRFL
ncbi:hypothetical protein [Psychromonas sp. SP041]|uniref:hypothetical protein n=1 Tax=Psychromonas sp. SP041 TaxID=1365007 RepID=UPI0004295AAE|nr:hypothetical protein [Psychromonas sp. SP041]